MSAMWVLLTDLTFKSISFVNFDNKSFQDWQKKNIIYKTWVTYNICLEVANE